MPTPRRRIALVATTVVLAGLLHAEAASPTGEAPVRARDSSLAVLPNIVLITTDDELMSDMRWMPRTRALIGRAGVTFPNSISPHPLCCPARASMLTGQYSHNTNVIYNSGTYGGAHALDAEHALPVWLARAGYVNGMVGKYLNGYTGSTGMPPGWTDFNALTTGTYDYFHYTLFNSGNPVTYDNGPHSNDTIAAETREVITKYAAGGRPFFVWSSYVAPHGECPPTREVRCDGAPRPAARHADLYQGLALPQAAKPSFNERDVSDKPPLIRQQPLLDRARLRHQFLQRIRSLASVDEGVADTLSALRESGVLDNTLIVFTSDNGYMLGEHRWNGKLWAYEESLKVPLLVRGPGVPAGQRHAQAVSTIDLAPTFAASAHARPLVTMDGRSLWPFLTDGDRAHRGNALVQVARDGDSHVWRYRGVRAPRYTFVRWHDGFVELYDRRRDPYEVRNVAQRTAYRSIRGELARRLRLLRTCSGSTCRTQFARLPAPRR